jgi:hypothetical protein
MKSRISNPYVAPFLLWHALGAKTVEMMLASAQVITHRTGRMASAGFSPSSTNRQELALMAQEKFDAGARSMLAMTTHLVSLSPLLGVRLFTHMLRTSTAMMSLANSRTAAQSMARQGALARTLGSARARNLSADLGRLVAHGVKPFHTRAVANAKRLGKR